VRNEIIRADGTTNVDAKLYMPPQVIYSSMRVSMSAELIRSATSVFSSDMIDASAINYIPALVHILND
jgi:hypothetical protein